MADAVRSTPQDSIAPARRVWTLPVLRELPKLTDLTLASAIGGGGGTGGGGSTVFGLLLATGLALLSACAPDQMVGPREAKPTHQVAAVSCAVKVSAKTISCGGPQLAGGPEIIGGQGSGVAFRSSNVHYDSGTEVFSFDVNFQNLTSQAIGYDGSSFNGIYVFFTHAPMATVGTGTILIDNAAGVGAFTHANQNYFWYSDFLAPQQTSSTQNWQFSVPGTVDEFSFSVLVAADVQDQGGILRWTEVSGTTRHTFNAMAWTSATDAMAVGGHGTSSHWDGTSWIPVTPVTNAQFTSVASLGGGRYVATGYDGGIYTFKGNVWTQVYTAAIWLTNVWARDADHFVAIGAHNAVVYDGSSFDEQTLPAGPLLTNVGGTSDGSVIRVLASDGESFTYAGPGNWTVDGSLFPDADPRVIRGMYFDDDGDMIWAFESGTEPYSAVIRGTNDTLVGGTLQQFVTAILHLGDDSLLVAVQDCCGTTTLRKVRYGAAPADFSITGGNDLTTGEFVDQLAPFGGTGDQFLAHTLTSATYQWTGSAFQDLETAPVATVAKFWLHLDTLYAVTGTSSMWQVANGNTVELINSVALKSVYGWEMPPPTMPEMMGVNAAGVWRRVGYTSYSLQFANPTAYELNDIMGDAGPKTWVAVGDGGTILEHAAVWSQIASPTTDDFTAIGTCFVMVTRTGKVFHYSSGTVTEDVDFNTTFSPGELDAVGGTGCSDVWVAGAGGNVYHWDGTAWSDMGAYYTGTTFRSISARANGEAYIGGDGGTLALYTVGNAPAPVAIPGLTGAITALNGAPGGGLFAGGGSFLLKGTH